MNRTYGLLAFTGVFGVMGGVYGCSDGAEGAHGDGARTVVRASAPSAGKLIPRWEAWAKKGFTPTEKEASELAKGVAIAGKGPLPMRHPNGLVEVDPATFERIAKGELAPQKDFAAWQAAGLYDPTSPAQAYHAKLYAARAAGDVTSETAPADFNYGYGYGSDGGSTDPDAGADTDAGGADAGPPPPPPLNCQVVCTNVITVPAAVPNTRPACNNFTVLGGTGPSSYYSPTCSASQTDNHLINVAAFGGYPSDEFAAPWGVQSDSGGVTGTELKIQATATCTTAPSDPNQPMVCPANLGWAEWFAGAAQDTATGMVSATDDGSPGWGYTTVDWKNEAKGGVRCGAEGAGYGTGTFDAILATKCTTTSTASGSVTVGWSQEKGWSGSLTGGLTSATTCESAQPYNLGSASCALDGPDQRLGTGGASGDSKGQPYWTGASGTTVFAAAGGANEFHAIAGSVYRSAATPYHKSRGSASAQTTTGYVQIRNEFCSARYDDPKYPGASSMSCNPSTTTSVTGGGQAASLSW